MKHKQYNFVVHMTGNTSMNENVKKGMYRILNHMKRKCMK